MAGVAGGDGGRNGVIIVLLMNFTVGYALKYAASPPNCRQKSFFFSIKNSQTIFFTFS